jgi:AsmA protein
MKLIKIALSAIVLLVLLTVAAVVLLPQFIDPNDYKSQITDTIMQKTGLETTIIGDLSLSVFPWLGISTGHIVLKQPTIIQQTVPKAGDFVDVQAIDIKVKLAPLFSRKVEVDTILLKQPRIEFVVNSAGKNSLAGISQASAPAPTSQNQAPAQNSSTAPAEPATIAAFTIAGVNISNGLFIFDDQQTKSRYELTQLNINSGNVLETTAPFSISGTLAGNAIEAITFTLDSELSLNKDTMAVAINDLRSSIEQGTNSVNANIDSIDYQHANATATISAVDVDANAEGYPLSLSIPSITVDINKAHVSIPALNANSNGVELSGNIEVKDWAKVPMVIGDIQSNTVNLQNVLEKLGVDYVPSNSAALSKVSFSSHFNATANGASLQKAKITIDDTVLTGDAAIINFTKPKYRFDLALNEIIIDDYLPLTDATNSTASANEKPLTATEALAAPIILLKDIYANGVFKAEKITANKIKLTNSVIKVTSTDSTVTITPTVDLYKGKLAGSTILKRGKNPTLLIKNTLTGVDLEPLLTDAEISEQLSGIANINTNITVSEKSGKPSTKGTVVLSVKNGAVEGVDIKKVLDDAQATIDKIRGKSVNQNTDSSEDETRFAEMSATLLIDNDIITNNDLLMKAPAFRVNGQGTVNTAAQTLDYLTSIVIVNTNSGQGGENLNDLKGFTIPVRFTGPLASPKYTIDTKALLKANAGKQLDKKKAELKEKTEAKKIELKAKADKKKAELKEKATEKLKESGKKLFDKLF